MEIGGWEREKEYDSDKKEIMVVINSTYREIWSVFFKPRMVKAQLEF